ncbi:hypothetical protein ACNVED_12665 [Legionella sp. D16C41]|uniref:hypothetical protein n=1 Tax=Legionella sp. D16C41 TaxID=3402688 RepID=UPI003AF9F34D
MKIEFSPILKDDLLLVLCSHGSSTVFTLKSSAYNGNILSVRPNITGIKRDINDNTKSIFTGEIADNDENTEQVESFLLEQFSKIKEDSEYEQVKTIWFFSDVNLGIPGKLPAEKAFTRIN